MREKITALLNEVSVKNKWLVYQYFEEAGAGILSESAPLPYPLRRPYQCIFSFIFIVNEDSLHAWQNWYTNDLQNAENRVVDSYKQVGGNLSKDATRQKYLDSANYFGDLKAKYMTDHIAEYQKALMTNDSKGQKKYDDEIKKYDDKINGCLNKTNGKTTEDFSSSKSQFDDLESYKHKNTIAYRNASIVRVSLNINDYLAIADDAEKKAQTLSIPASTLALLIHNNVPDEHEIFGQYLRSPDVAMLLFGKWVLKKNQYNSYQSVYATDKKNTDVVAVKKTPCDKVQTMVLHVEGSVKYINQFLHSFDLQQLNELIVK